MPEKMKRLLIITDTTPKQTNGVVRTLSKTLDLLPSNFVTEIIDPTKFKSIQLPFYKEIDISLDLWKIGNLIEQFNPEYIHIVTEGPVGVAGKIYCDHRKYSYTTGYHSKFPEFINAMFNIPHWVTYPYFKWFHSKSKAVYVPTNSVLTLLKEKGFNRLVRWSRGVDRAVFNSTYRFNGSEGIILCVSRVSKEKGLDDFCNMPCPDGYTKVLVGDGPYLDELKSKHNDVQFTGMIVGEDLAFRYANADMFVFPSKNDTFGLTQLEAMASGTPILAYKGTCSDEIIKNGVSGYLVDVFTLDDIDKCLALPRHIVEQDSENWTWETCNQVFVDNLVEAA